MATLFHDMVRIVAGSATSEAEGYEFENVTNPRILRPWRSTAAAGQVLTLDTGSLQAISGVLLQHCNAASAAVHASDNLIDWADVGTLSIVADDAGRRKGLIPIDDVARHVRFTFASTTADGRDLIEVGAAWVYGSAYALPRAPEYGMSVKHVRPQVSADLPNGRRALAGTGPEYSEIEISLDERWGEDMAQIVRAARDEVVVFDLDVASLPGCVWPLRWVAGETAGTLERFNQIRRPVVLREEV